MNPAACNPVWLTIISALDAPIIALLVGGFGVFIARRQWLTAQNRLKLDLFDRRLPVYEQTRELLARRMALAQVDNKEITEFAIKVRIAKWLFNPAMADYLDYLQEIAKKTSEINFIQSELEETLDEARRKELVSKQRERKEWLDDQLYKVIDGRFSEFLHLEHS
jgi:hypothetical protein